MKNVHRRARLGRKLSPARCSASDSMAAGEPMKSALLATLLCFLLLPATAEPSPKKKLIEFGWDEPDTAFVRKHVTTMERNTPFDGCVFHANWRPVSGAAGKGGNFTWECWSSRAFDEAELAQALADLKAAPAKSMRHNFLRFNVTPGDVDWFDDDAFKSVVNNAKVAAKFTRDSG